VELLHGIHALGQQSYLLLSLLLRDLRCNQFPDHRYHRRDLLLLLVPFSCCKEGKGLLEVVLQEAIPNLFLFFLPVPLPCSFSVWPSRALY
jgi:hypothetical protein